MTIDQFREDQNETGRRNCSCQITPIFKRHEPTNEDTAEIHYHLEGQGTMDKTSWVILGHRYEIATAQLQNFISSRNAKPYDVRLTENSYKHLITRIGDRQLAREFVSTTELQLGHARRAASQSPHGQQPIPNDEYLPINALATTPQHEVPLLFRWGAGGIEILLVFLL